MSSSARAYDVAVIGGGFFGCAIAVECARRGRSVVLLEKEPDLLRHASYVNQARVHNGYHYPRSVLTAFRSRVNFPRFLETYPECVDRSFQMYYAIGRHRSNITAPQFVEFCRRIGADVGPVPAGIRAQFSDQLIEDVFEVTECAFNAARLRDRAYQDLRSTGVRICTNALALHVREAPGGRGRKEVTVHDLATHGEAIVSAGEVYLCAYAWMNRFLEASGLPLVALKHEVVELALLEVPDPLRALGITVMCGPFFGTMPFPARGVHSLYHVRYAVHYGWHETGLPEDRLDPEALEEVDRQVRDGTRRSNITAMIKDAQRYVPLLAHSRHVESLWDIRTVLPASEESDSRPILFRRDHGLAGFHCVSGAKIDNVFDLIDALHDHEPR